MLENINEFNMYKTMQCIAVYLFYLLKKFSCRIFPYHMIIG